MQIDFSQGTPRRIVCIGECLIEMSGGEDSSYRISYAGDTLNSAWYMRALLGVEWSVDYVTAIGDDRYSQGMRSFISDNGIGTEYIQKVAGRLPGLYMIHQEEGDRHFTYWRDCSAARLLADDLDALSTAVERAAVIYFSGITLAILSPVARERLLGVIASARDSGSKVVFDTNIRPSLWSTTDVMTKVLTAAAEICDIVLPTYVDEAMFFGDRTIDQTADRLLGLGVAEVVVKDGGSACLAATASERILVSPTPNGNVIDGTGAGDSFNGAYLSARLSGESIQESAAFAHLTAGIVIGHHGALVKPSLLLQRFK